MEFELGRTYSGYKFLEVAHRSKTGVEYRVQNTLAQRMELLKSLPPSDQGDQEAADRFLREMRFRARLAHPNIVTFFTALPIDGQMVMTTELFEGLSLADRLQTGPLPWQDALEAARQLLAAAACAHSLKIVHRDITPANIVMGADGVLKLTNFRFAVAINGPSPSESGAIVGSPKYISPEQVKGAQDIDERSDLYSIGIVLYEMLCGRTPFDARSQFELMLAHVNQIPTPPAEVNPSLPRQLDAVVLKALAKDPEHRYQSAAAFADALEWTGSQLPAEAFAPPVSSRPRLSAVEAVEPPAAEPVAA
jgi:eukaryotic-like serine/threonine-protein kinase